MKRQVTPGQSVLSSVREAIRNLLGVRAVYSSWQIFCCALQAKTLCTSTKASSRERETVKPGFLPSLFGCFSAPKQG